MSTSIFRRGTNVSVVRYMNSVHGLRRVIISAGPGGYSYAVSLRPFGNNYQHLCFIDTVSKIVWKDGIMKLDDDNREVWPDEVMTDWCGEIKLGEFLVTSNKIAHRFTKFGLIVNAPGMRILSGEKDNIYCDPASRLWKSLEL